MNDNEKQLDKIAAALERVAADVRNMTRADITPIVEQLDTAIMRIRVMDIPLGYSEYYECYTCNTDFHTAAQSGGRECREYRQAAILEGMRHAARVANN